MSKILVVDDEVGIRELLSEILCDEGHEVLIAENATKAREFRKINRPDLVLLDIWMPDTDGVTLLKEWASNGQLTMPVIIMSGHGTIDTAVQATRIGAHSFLEKPFAVKKLLITVNSALKQEGQVSQNINLVTVGKSQAVELLRKQLDKLKLSGSNAMFVGEPGSGADECARQLRASSKPWLEFSGDTINGLKEANEKIKSMSDGVIFVNNIHQLDKNRQNWLLSLRNILGEKNIRLVCSSENPLASPLALGNIETHFYQLVANIIVRVPSLKERPEDIPELASLMLDKIGDAGGGPPRTFSTAALNLLRNYSWPGNFLQLHSLVKSCLEFASESEISVDEVNNALASMDKSENKVGSPFSLNVDLRTAREEFERNYFRHQINRFKGSVSKIASEAGIERTHLYRKLKQLGISLSKRDDKKIK